MRLVALIHNTNHPAYIANSSTIQSRAPINYTDYDKLDAGPRYSEDNDNSDTRALT